MSQYALSAQNVYRICNNRARSSFSSAIDGRHGAFALALRDERAGREDAFRLLRSVGRSLASAASSLASLSSMRLPAASGSACRGELLKTSAKQFMVRKVWLHDSDRVALRNFWESKYGPYGAFRYGTV